MNKKLISILTLSILVIFCLAALALAQDNNDTSEDNASSNYNKMMDDDQEMDDESSLTSEEEFFNKHGYYPPYSEPELTPEEKAKMQQEQEQFQREEEELAEKYRKGILPEPEYPPQTKEEKEFWEQRKKESDKEDEKIKENSQIVKNVLNRIYNKKYKIDITKSVSFDREIFEDVITILKTQTLNANEKKALQIYVCEHGVAVSDEPLYAEATKVLQDITFDPQDPYGLYE